MERATELFAVVGKIDPDAYSASTELTEAIDCSYWDQLVFTVMAGTLGSSATLDFKVTSSATSGGTYTDVSGAAITQLTQAGTDSDKVAIVVLDTTHIATLGKRFVKGSLTIATAASDAGVVVYGFRSRYLPATQYDLAAVDEIVIK